MQGYKYKKIEQFKNETIVRIKYETVEILVDEGVKINVKTDNTNMTCLHWACVDPEDYRIVSLLLRKGAHLLVIDTKGLLPLDIAGINATLSNSEVNLFLS
jgi:ankyrin repeat protein